MFTKNAMRVQGVIVVLCLSIVAVTTRGESGEVPKVDFMLIRSQDNLRRDQQEQIAKRIAYWLSMLRNTEDPSKVIEARSGLVKDYKAVEKFQYEYADEAGKQGIAIFGELSGKLKSLKEVNLGLGLSQMSQVTIQTSLDKMVVHPNPAVRFHGWRGYRRIRAKLLAQGASYIADMVKSLQVRAKAETSAPVVGTILQMIYTPPVPPRTVAQDIFLKHQEASYKILHDNWKQWCMEVLKGDGEMADVSRKGISGAMNFARVFRNDRRRRTVLMQMILDMTYCSRGAFEAAIDSLKEGDSKHKKPIMIRTRDANAQLLRDCERALGYVTQEQMNPIERVLSNPDEENPADKVGSSIYEWLDVLKAQGVTDPEPRFKAPPTTVAPKENKP